MNIPIICSHLIYYTFGLCLQCFVFHENTWWHNNRINHIIVTCKHANDQSYKRYLSTGGAIVPQLIPFRCVRQLDWCNGFPNNLNNARHSQTKLTDDNSLGFSCVCVCVCVCWGSLVPGGRVLNLQWQLLHLSPQQNSPCMCYLVVLPLRSPGRCSQKGIPMGSTYLGLRDSWWHHNLGHVPIKSSSQAYISNKEKGVSSSLMHTGLSDY
jgi:hypothetical protein